MRLIYILIFMSVANIAMALEQKNIASLGDEPIGLGHYLQMFFGLFIVVILIVVMAWFMRRISNVSGLLTDELKILGSISVGQRERLMLVKVGDTQLLVGVAPGFIGTIHVMEKPIFIGKEHRMSSSSNFAEKFHMMLKQRIKR